MKKYLVWILLCISSSAFAVEGYKDIYLDRESDIVIHSIYCGKDFNSINKLKPAYVFSNTPSIEKGTYYYNSPYGTFSYTFNTTKKSEIMARGLLKVGQSKKQDMVKELCIVKPLKGLPTALNTKIASTVLSANDPQWDKKMELYRFAGGKPAFAKGVYQDQRTIDKQEQANDLVFKSYQQYIQKIEQIFNQKFKKIAKKLPMEVKKAITYAHKHDGKVIKKTYPIVKEPSVWTPTAKKRYNDLSRQRNQRMAWDKVIQQNFDWLFALTGKENALQKTQLVIKSKPKWNSNKLEQTATVIATFNNGKSLILDFLISSSEVDGSIFDSKEIIEKKALLARNNPIASDRSKLVKPIKMPNNNDLDVYSPTEKTINFFSLFRHKTLGDGYLYQ